MPEDMLTLDDLAKLKKQREEEKSKLPYKDYLDNLKTLIYEKNPKIYDSIKKPESHNEQFICIKEPLEFINLFNRCNGQDECKSLFQELLAIKDPRVVEQVIEECEDTQGLWFNTTQNGINLRPGLKDEEWSSPTTITLGDDAVHSLVAGRTGSGKSVFLNSIIFSLLAEYSPWELDLYLADFKKVEFSRYLSKCNVPHIKAVAATSEIRYVLISDGRLDEEKLAKICDEKTKVLSISWVQALNGMVTDLQMCSEFCQTHDIVFVVDAIQGLGVLPIDVKKVHIDFLVSGFFKWLLGPDGIAFVYINQEILGNLNNPFIGWAGMKNKFDYTTYKFDLLLEARRYETGNMNFSGIFGARQGVEIILEHQEEIGEKVQNLTQYLRDAVQKLDGAEVLSPAEGEMAGITLIGCRDSKQKYELLQKKGITVNYRNGIRVSLHFYNTTEDIDCFLGTIR